ncbi:hypothetical protein ARMSODRAFT_105199 [Armillaria solidipes]|uniref:Uncharacterized protein n=1 Tax=Armillaria solidipes TaxID=1076256 RepID=A0A2H3ALL2_9AGAR|nr:hypothetical protein ARMSODRAFT_105199 [Armillaria solidipes]
MNDQCCMAFMWCQAEEAPIFKLVPSNSSATYAEFPIQSYIPAICITNAAFSARLHSRKVLTESRAHSDSAFYLKRLGIGTAKPCRPLSHFVAPVKDLNVTTSYIFIDVTQSTFQGEPCHLPSIVPMGYVLAPCRGSIIESPSNPCAYMRQNLCASPAGSFSGVFCNNHNVMNFLSHR